MSSKDRFEKDPLEPVLRDAEAQLRDRLREACEAEASGISTASAEGIRRLEDSLLAAAGAAEQTLNLRRHMARRGSETFTRPEPSTASSHEATEPVLRVREFRDADGQLWRAWPVTPGQARTGRTAERYLGEFHKGWICFEALQGNARRRLVGQPEDWTELKESELCQLLQRAINAPQRKPAERTAPPSPPGLH